MANSIDRLAGHAYAPGHEQVTYGPWGEFLSQFDGFFFMFCTVGLLYVVVSQYSRHRRRQKNLDVMRKMWEVEARSKGADIGVNPKLRYDAGFWGDGA